MLKRKGRMIAVIAVAAILLIPVLQCVYSAADGLTGGTGTEDDPFLISSVDDLKRIGTGEYTLGSSYRQTADIVFTDGDALNTDGPITLTLTKDDVGLTVTLTVMLNDVVLQTDEQGDFMEASLNGAVGVRSDTRAVFEFPYDAFEQDGDNFAVVIGRTSHGDIGAVTVFGDLPHHTVAPMSGNFTPIGTSDLPFTGTYDGRGHSRTGLKAVSVSDGRNGGMFGCINGATITGLSIIDAPGNRSYVLSGGRIGADATDVPAMISGGVVGEGHGSRIYDVHNEGTVIVFAYAVIAVTGADGDLGISVVSCSGGIAGIFSGTVSNCSNRGTVAVVSAASLQDDGGSDRSYTFDITGISGGIVGSANDATIENCRNISAVSVSVSGDAAGGTGGGTMFIMTELSAGGVAGYVRAVDIVNTSHAGTVATALHANAGLSDIADVYSVEYSGGIAGTASGDVLLANCHAVSVIINTMTIGDGDVRSVERDVSRGGLAGSSSDDGGLVIVSSACTSSFVPDADDGDYMTGGLVGEVLTGGLSVDETYYLDDGRPPFGNGTLGPDGYAKDLAGMSMADYGSSWDFERIWSIGENGPVLMPRFQVRFVSEDLSLFSISYHSGPTDGTYLVDDVRKRFSIVLSEASKMSVPVLTDADTGEAITCDGLEFTVPMEMDGLRPRDRTVNVYVSVNVYTVRIVSELPAGVTASVLPAEGVPYGGTVEIAFRSDDRDVSRLELSVEGDHDDVTYKGRGVYSVAGVTSDIDVTVGGFSDRGDMTPLLAALGLSLALVISAVISGATRLRGMRSEDGG